MSIIPVIAKNIKRYRKERHVTQETLGKASDVSRIAIIHIETGKAVPTLQTLEKICVALQISLQELIAEKS